MSELPNISGVSDKYDVVRVFCKTHTTTGYFVEDKQTKQESLLFVLNEPFSMHSQAATNFPRRIRKLEEEIEEVLPFQHCSLDNSGYAYVIAAPVNVRPLKEVIAKGKLSLEIFIKIVKCISEIHNEGIILGDICEESFFIDNENGVILVSILGSPDVVSPAEERNVPSNLLQFLSPEQYKGERFDRTSDVFALGSLGYWLLTGKYINESNDSSGFRDPAKIAAAPSVIGPDIPIWFDAVIGGSVEPQRSSRYSTAKTLLEALEQGVRTGLVPGGSNRWVSRSLVAKNNAKQEETSDVVSREEAGSMQANPETESKKVSLLSKPLFIALLSIVLIGGGIIVFVNTFIGERNAALPVEENDALTAHLELAPPELQQKIKQLQDVTLSTEDYKKVLEEIATSKDPVSFSLLTSVVLGEVAHAEQGTIQQLGEDVLVQKIKDTGAINSARVIKDWFGDLRSARTVPGTVSGISEILRAVDSNRKDKSRQYALQQAFNKQQVIALRLSVAMALDEPNNEKFTNIAKSFLAGSGVRDIKDLSFYALAVIHKDIANYFKDEFAASTEKFSNSDLSWAISKTVTREGALFYDLVDEILKRNIVPPFQRVFLEALTSKAKLGLPKEVKESLVSASLGRVTQRHIQDISTWGGKHFERILLALCVISPNEKLAGQVLEILSERLIQSQPAAQLVKWSQGLPWEKRKTLAKPIGILGLIDLATDAEINFAFGTIMGHSGGTELFRATVKSENAKLTQEALHRIGPIMPPGELIPLLQNKHKEVRIAAVKALKGINDVEILHKISRAFERETDKEVIKVYDEVHWVARNKTKN